MRPSVSLPRGWAVTTLGAAFRWGSGGTPRKGTPGYYGGDIPWAVIGDLNDGVVSGTAAAITERGLEESSAKWVEPDSVLVAMYGSIGKLGTNSIRLTTNQAIAFTRPDPIPARYLFYYLMAERPSLIRQGKGGTQSNISQTVLKAYPFVVAPGAEQQRIVEEIESYLTRLDNAVTSLERVQTNLKRYRASVLKAAVEGRLVPTEAELARREGRSYEPASELLKRIFVERKARWIEDAAEKARAKAEIRAHKAGQPWTSADDAATLEKERANAAKQYKEPAGPDTGGLPDVPEGWCWASPGQLFSWASGEFLPKKSQREGGVPVYGGNGITGYHDVALVDIPTLVVGRVGAQCGNVHASVGPAWITDNAIYASEGGERANLDYWQLALSVEDLNAGAAGTGQPYVNQTHLNALVVPFPPQDEQARIAEEVSRLLSVADRTASIASATALRCVRLRQSILKWAFEGKLVEQDPNDEPASVLLERIKAERAAAGTANPRGKKRRSAE